MEIEEIKFMCNIHMCGYCPLYDEEEYECMLDHCPNNWDLEEIERRLENYGKKEEK
jgi:hypothetical protein